MTMNYEPFIQKAFRYLLKDVLKEVSQHGLQGESHLFITFQTNRQDVVIPEFVRAKYPEQMSIILQHQFENLIANETEFSVDLAFGGVSTTLVIPYSAVLQFSDTAANFGFIFEPEFAPAKKPQAEVISLSERRKS